MEEIKDKKGEVIAKVATKTEALWTKVKMEAEALIKQSEENLIIQKEMLNLALTKIAAENSKDMPNSAVS